MLGTLSVVGIITVTTYEGYFDQIIFEDVSDPPNQFLLQAAYYAEHYSIFYKKTKQINQE